MVSWYSDSEIAYSIHCQTILSTIYLDVDLCNRRGKSVCSQYLYLFKTLWCLFQKLTTEMNLSCKVHSAIKHNISGLLEIIEIHKYIDTVCKIHEKHLLFNINSCSFVHSGLNEVWRFGMLMLWYDVVCTWRLVYVFNQWYIRYLFETAFSESFVWPEILRHKTLCCCVPIKILVRVFLGLQKGGHMNVRLEAAPDTGQGA